MRVTEIWTGTSHEQQILEASRRIQEKVRLSKQDRLAIQTARNISRRILLRRVGSAVALAALGSTGIVAYEALRRSEPDTEKAYNSYIEGFELIAQGDEEAIKLLDFFKERRRRGKLAGDRIIADEPGNVSNFYTVIIDPNRNRREYLGMRGAAEYRHTESPTVLVLKDVPMTRIWKGALLAHESLHVFQWLNGIEQSRPGGFLRGEQEAHDLEFRLLDKATEGRFITALRQQAQSIEKDKYRGRLSSNDLHVLESIFPPPISKDEVDLRIPAYLVALNFTAAEMRSSNPAEATDKKIDYLSRVFSGELPLLR